jgi:putative SOS response-associated peptidase YedK
MCGRFTLHIPPELLAEIFGLVSIPDYQVRHNIAPTQKVPVIRQDAGGLNQLVLLHWGLIPSWAKDPSTGNRMINARAETVHENPAFRNTNKYHRCLIEKR